MSTQKQNETELEENNQVELEESSNNQEKDADQAESSIDLSAELEEAKVEVEKYKDAYIRAKAEEDNVRRRSEKEIANSRKFAVEGFAKELLTVRDSLVLACNVEVDAQTEDTVKRIHEGVEITLKQIDVAFAKFSVVEIAPQVGDKLDPNLHQAMSMVESDEITSGHIITVIQSGFQLHERLLRPAMVVVAK